MIGYTKGNKPVLFFYATCAACSLDELLEGGIYSGEVTELCGAPGVGKTQVSNVFFVCFVFFMSLSVMWITGCMMYSLSVVHMIV